MALGHLPKRPLGIRFAEAPKASTSPAAPLQSIDHQSSAADDLRIARTAIREALDFSGVYGDLNTDGVKRIARSHRSEIITRDRQNISATDAIDQYLNKARVRLSRLATSRVEAAQAMDLLAAIHLGRNRASLVAQ